MFNQHWSKVGLIISVTRSNSRIPKWCGREIDLEKNIFFKWSVILLSFNYAAISDICFNLHDTMVTVINKWTNVKILTIKGHEKRVFRASETTHFAIGQPSINLRVSVGQPVKNWWRFTKICKLFLCMVHYPFNTWNQWEICRESQDIIFIWIFFHV